MSTRSVIPHLDTYIHLVLSNRDTGPAPVAVRRFLSYVGVSVGENLPFGA